MKTPFIGQLDRKIEILKETQSQNAMGEQKPVESVVSNPWAYMEEAGGDEDVEGKVRHLIERKYTIRYNNDVLSNGHEYLVKDAGIKYEVYHVMEIGRRQYIQLLVTKHE